VQTDAVAFLRRRNGRVSLFFAVLFAGGAEVAAQPTKTQPTKTQPTKTMCRNTGSFEKWLSDFKREALQQGISQRTLSRTAHLLVLDQKVIGIDRGQRVVQPAVSRIRQRMAGSDARRAGRRSSRSMPLCSRRSKRSSACRRR
jgi:membrane-bound lytic murein transglycosylase B